MISLQYLGLNENCVAELPPTIGKLAKLEVLGKLIILFILIDNKKSLTLFHILIKRFKI